MGEIYNRCKCAGLIKQRYPNPDELKQFEEWLLDANEKDKELIPTCENTLKQFNSLGLRLSSDKDPCESCPIVEVKPKDFRPLELNGKFAEKLPSVPKFPIEIIPEPFKSYIQDVANSVDCMIEYVAMAMLVYWSAVVGLKQEIVIKDDWIEPCMIWGAIIGLPSSGKTPGIDKCRTFIRELEYKSRKNYENKMEEYERQMAEFELESKGNIKIDKPELPELHRYEIQDATREASSKMMYKNPNGIIMSQDELSAFFTGLDQYKKGNAGADRQFWLTAWSSKQITVDRVSSEDYFIEKPFCSIIGALLPDYLKMFRDPKAGYVEDGMTARFLFLYPKEHIPFFKRESRIKQENHDAVQECFKWMDETVFIKDRYNINTDGYVKLSTQNNTAKLYTEWVNGVHRRQMEKEIPEDLKIHWGKLGAYVPRLALLFHTMREARAKKIIPYMMDESMERAINIIEKCFKPHIKKVYYVKSLTRDEKIAYKLYDWMVSKGESLYYLTDLNQRFKPNGKGLGIGTITIMCEILDVHGRGKIFTKKKMKYIYVFKENRNA